MTLLTQTGLQNIYTPLPLKFHALFCILATVILIVQLLRKKRLCYLFLIFGVNATILTHYAFDNPAFIMCIEIFEALIIALCLIDIILNYKRKRDRTKNERLDAKKEHDDLKSRENNEIIKNGQEIENAFDDPDLDDLDK